MLSYRQENACCDMCGVYGGPSFCFVFPSSSSMFLKWASPLDFIGSLSPTGEKKKQDSLWRET